MIEKLQHQLHGANRHRFGSKSEGMDQLQLFAENEEIAEAAVKAAETAPAEPIELKEKPRRKPLPDHLERIEQVLSVGEDCPECGGDLSKLGEDITEELEYIPGRFVVNKITRPRMACRRCEAISQAPMPSRPIERGRPGPGLLAHVLVSKFADHLPLYRQSQIYAREGVDLDRSTMADWVGKSTGLLEPLAEAIAKRAKGGTSLFADDTPLKMLAPGNKKTKTARIWAYVRDERPWSGPCATGAQTDNLSSCAGRAPPCVWYQFTVDRKGEHPVKHLSGYQGCERKDNFGAFWNNSTEATSAFKDAGSIIGQTWDTTGLLLNREDPKFVYRAPTEGIITWLDSFGMLKAAENREQAIAFMNFMLTPAIGGMFANNTGYNSAVSGSAAFATDDFKRQFSEVYTDQVLGNMWWWQADTPFFAPVRNEFVEIITNA